MKGCGEKIQIGMGAFETCGSDYYGSPIYCERYKLLLEIDFPSLFFKKAVKYGKRYDPYAIKQC